MSDSTTNSQIHLQDENFQYKCFFRDGNPVNGKIQFFGNCRWFEDGFLHRIDGPAIDFDFGRKEWWLHGQKVANSEEEFLVYLAKKGLNERLQSTLKSKSEYKKSKI